MTFSIPSHPTGFGSAIYSVFFVLLTASASEAQYLEPSSYLTPTVEITLGSPGYSTDLVNDTAVFQQAIDDVASGGGGKVIIPRGTYEIGPVKLKSNVHVVFDGHSTVRANAEGFSPTKNINLFDLGDSSGAVQDVSVRSINSSTRFELDNSHHERLRAFRVADASNFLVSNFDIADTRTIFSGMSLGWAGDNPDGTAQLPDGGTVEHLRSSNAHYGYGAIQAQGSKNVLFKGIQSVGGVALRVETGYKLLNETLARGDRMEKSIDNVTAEDISSFHGQTALMFAPHGMHQGSVSAQNVKSIGSEYAVLIEEGSLHKFTEQEIIDLDLTEGEFESISVDGVDATFTAGPIETRWVHMNHYPAEFHRNGLAPSVYRLPEIPAVYDHRYRGPSIAPVSNALLGDASVTITNINSTGFQYSPDQINDPFPDSSRGQVAMDGTPLAGRLIGDINDDELWTAEDLDLLFDSFGPVIQGGPFDLINNDGVASDADAGYWLRSILGSEYGDADLDGRVSFLDIEIVASNFDEAGSWGDGDFNNDGTVNLADLSILEQYYAPHLADEQLTFQEALIAVGLVLPKAGDFNGDGVVDAADVDLLSANFGNPATTNPAMDLNSDDTIDLADHDQHITALVEDANGTGALIGDLNLDGDVDVSQFDPITFTNVGDASRLLANLGQSNGMGYADGDLNGDGDVDVSQFDPITFTNVGDASRLLAKLGQTTAPSGAPATSAVPEPGSLAMLTLVGIAGMICCRKC